MSVQPIEAVEPRTCIQCARDFTVPLKGYGRQRRKCHTCAPSPTSGFAAARQNDREQPQASLMRTLPDSPDPSGALISSEPLEPVSDVPKEPRPKGRFETRTEEIVAKFKNPDEGYVLAAISLGRALDSPEITPPQIASVTKQWLSVMDTIKYGEPLEPDDVDELSHRAEEKKLRRL